MKLNKDTGFVVSTYRNENSCLLDNDLNFNWEVTVTSLASTQVVGELVPCYGCDLSAGTYNQLEYLVESWTI